MVPKVLSKKSSKIEIVQMMPKGFVIIDECIPFFIQENIPLGRPNKMKPQKHILSFERMPRKCSWGDY